MSDPAKLVGALSLMVGALAASITLGHCAPTQRAAIRIVPDSDGPDAEWREVTLPPGWSLDAGRGAPNQ